MMKSLSFCGDVSLCASKRAAPFAQKTLLWQHFRREFTPFLYLC